MPPKEKQVIDLNTLDPEQLSMLKEQFQQELDGLMRSTIALQKAAGEFGASGQAVEALQDQEEGALLNACLAVQFQFLVRDLRVFTSKILLEIYHLDAMYSNRRPSLIYYCRSTHHAAIDLLCVCERHVSIQRDCPH